jgi:hypothetical protein
MPPKPAQPTLPPANPAWPFTSGLSIEAADALDTATLTLAPDFLEALRRQAARRRGTRLPYVVCLALLAVAAVLSADPAARDLIAARVRRIARTPVAQPASPAPVSVLAPPLRTIVASTPPPPVETNRPPDGASTQPPTLPAKGKASPRGGPQLTAGRRPAVGKATHLEVSPEGT